MKKRIISALLAVCLLVSLGTVGVFADEPETEPTAGDVYDTLPEAKEGVITLDKDVVLSTSADIEGNVVLDLNGHSITASDSWTFGGTNDYLIGVKRGAKLTITDSQTGGKIDATNPKANGLIVAVKLTIKDEGETGNTAALVVEDGTITGTDYAISGNGSRHGTSVVINGGNIIATKGTGIYNPQDGTLTVNGGSITGVDSAIELRSGTLNITGGSFTASASEYKPTPNNSGTTVTGAAVAISQHTTKKPITVSISGGTFTGAYAFAQTDIQNNGSTNNVKITGISNGIFNGNVSSDNCTGFITGGTFKVTDEKFAAYLAPGLDVDDSGKVVVGSDAVAQVGNTVYTNLQEAINAAITAKKPVEILKDFTITVPNGTAVKTGAVNINGNVTIDGNGHIITADTKTFTFEKENLGNYHVINIQNGADVTITNLKIDGNKCARSGINVYSANGSVNASATLTGVTVRNCTAYGVVAASSTVTVNSITTSGNGWGGINVDSSYANASLTVKDAAITDTYSVVVEGDANNNVVDLKNGSYNNIQVKTSNSDVTIVNGSYYDIVGGDGYVPTRSDVVVKGGTFDNSVEKFADSKLIYEVRVGGEYTYYTNASDAIAAAGPSGDVDYIGDPINTHTVTFVYDKNTKTSIEVVNRDEIELPGGKFGGKVITGWTRGSVTYDVGDEVRVTDDMTFYVVLKDGEFDIVIDSKIKHGTITTNVNSADRGDVVRIYVDPDTGYVLDELKVYTGTNYRTSVKVTYVNDSTYRFTMPGDDVYITATFKANGMPFVDVHRTQWFYDSIYYVWSNDMMEGDSATTFNPDGTMTRAMFWAVLGRMDGQTITGTNWVEQARNWAMREGVSDGTNPNDYVTREQMVTMLWRYAGEKNGSANLNRYTDSGSVSGYAVEAMRWAIGNGVIQGVTSTTLAPKANATRAECATIFMRFDKM